MSSPWRIIFMGTPEFAQPSLSRLVASEDEVVLVLTQPDRPRGRGRKEAPPPVKEMACDLCLPLWQPEAIKTRACLDYLETIEPDLLVVVAFGLMLSPDLLTLPRFGALNVHPSLLPAYRGPAPINWAVINGDRETGVTTMMLDRGMDTGPTMLSRRVLIGAAETAGELHDRLAVLGADLLVETIAGMKGGQITPVPQPETGASLAPMLKKADGLLDWTRPADELAALIRGLDPWPGAFTVFNDRNLKVFGAEAGRGRGEPGQILALIDHRLHVAAGRGSVGLSELQLAGKKRLPADKFWHGHHLDSGGVFGR